MPKEWKLTRKWTIKAAQKLTFADIQKMSTAQRADLAQYLQNQFKRRVKQAEKAGVELFAVKKFYRDYRDKYGMEIEVGDKKVTLGEFMGVNIDAPITVAKKGKRMLSPEASKMRYAHNSLLAIINNYLDFFNSKSSTVKGWREIQRDQDRLLFGGSKKKPKRTMTEYEREQFWKAVDEIRKRGSTALDYQHSEALVETDFTNLYQEGVDFTDLVELTNRIETLIRGETLSFEEFYGNDSETPGDPFGPVGDIEEPEDNWVW